MNSGVLEALRQGRLVARHGIERFDGHTVHFTDGTREEFDAIIMATGFRISFPFLSKQVADWDMAKPPPLYLRMMHPTIPSLFFIGLFQPIGCIWRLADYQARIAALQISGRLQRPPDIAARIRHEVAHPRSSVRSVAPARDRGRLPRLPARTDARACSGRRRRQRAATRSSCVPDSARSARREQVRPRSGGKLAPGEVLDVDADLTSGGQSGVLERGPAGLPVLERHADAQTVDQG